MQDDLNRASVEALMEKDGIDGYAVLARRMEKVSDRTFERSYVSRVMRGERPAQPSFIVAAAKALRVPTVAITGHGIDLDELDEAS
jgi:hypothetical protein